MNEKLVGRVSEAVAAAEGDLHWLDAEIGRIGEEFGIDPLEASKAIPAETRLNLAMESQRVLAEAYGELQAQVNRIAAIVDNNTVRLSMVLSAMIEAARRSPEELREWAQKQEINFF